MDTALTVSLVIIGARLLTAPLVLRWPVAGVFVNMLADTLDFPFAQHLGWGLFGEGRYQLIDKVLDTWYLLFLFILVCRWKHAPARRIATALFIWRLAGVLALAMTGEERVLVLAPNIFEYFYLFGAIVMKWAPRFALTPRRLTLIVTLLGVVKVAAEIRVHWFHASWGLFDRFLAPWLFS